MSTRTIGVGIMGTGFARSTQIPCFQATPGFEVVGILSRNMTRAYDLAKEFAIRRAFDDADSMLAVPEIGPSWDMMSIVVEEGVASVSAARIRSVFGPGLWTIR